VYKHNRLPKKAFFWTLCNFSDKATDWRTWVWFPAGMDFSFHHIIETL